MIDETDSAAADAQATALLRSLPGAVFRCRNDTDRTMLFISPGVHALTGFTADELLRNRPLGFAALALPEDRASADEAIAAAVTANRPYAVSYRIRTADGSVRRLWEQGRGVRDGHGVTVALEGYLTSFDGQGGEADPRAAETGDIDRNRLELLAFAADSSNDATYLIDESGRLLDVNRRACAMLGYSRKELLGMTLTDLDPSYAAQDWSGQWPALQALGSMPMHTEHRRRDGGLIPVEARGYFFEHDGRRFNLSVVRDMSRQSRLQRMQRLQSSVLEMISSDSPLEDVLNRLAQGLEEVTTGVRASILLPAAEGTHLRHGAGSSLPAEYNALVDGLPIGEGFGCCGTAAHRREQVVVRDTLSDPLWADYTDVARRYDLRASWSTPVLDGSGRVLAVFALYRSEPHEPGEVERESVAHAVHLLRMAIEHDSRRRALELSQHRLRHAVEAMADVIWHWDVDSGRIWRDTGESGAFGYSAAELQGDAASWMNRVHPDDRARVEAAIERARTEGLSRMSCEYRFRRANGSYAQVIEHTTLDRHPDGRLRHVIGGTRDISERRALAEQLQQAQRMEAVGQLTGGLAHDFNNLLTVILGNAELLHEHLRGQERMQQLARLVATAAQRGADLTERLLAFSRRQALQPRSVDVDELIGDLQPLLKRTLGEHIEIAHRPNAAAPPALADPTQLESGLLNLALNARDAMPSGGRLTLATGAVRIGTDDGALAPGHYLRLDVSDTGKGIAAEDLPHVFEPFFTRKAHGSGLGLSMVFGFARQSGGHVSIESTPDRGTTVRLYLPVADAPAERPEAQAVAPGTPPHGDGQHVLLVEDEPLVLEYALAQLQRLGYRVIAAGDGKRALELLRGGGPVDLLFTDVVMPGGLNGPQLVEAARALGMRGAVLYTSGYTDQAFAHGTPRDAPLLRKPYGIAELAAAVRGALEAHAASGSSAAGGGSLRPPEQDSPAP